VLQTAAPALNKTILNMATAAAAAAANTTTDNNADKNDTVTKILQDTIM